MEAQQDSYQPQKLKTTTPGEQYTRQRISDTWQPNGFDRYAYQKALVESMPVLGGAVDQYGGNPDRYLEADPKEAEFPVKQPGRRGQGQGQGQRKK